ncbi:MAG TPA: hypothetical protein VNA57_05640, partial [Acidimicrobiales bacterium]|nr:hypothetical protein [Acidimicrobiales bacterium]
MRAVKLTVLTVLLSAAVLVAPVPSAPPAAAGHSLGQFLQVTPEVSVVPLSGVLKLRAQLFTGAVTRVAVADPINPVVIQFSEQPASPAALSSTTCTVPAGASTCETTASSATAVDKVFRAWIDGHHDTTEARLANRDAADQASADCIGQDENESDATACTSIGETVEDGATTEPDQTDVVKASWQGGGVDVVADDQRVEPGRQATFTATAYDINGNPAPGIEVKFEFFDLSVSDGDGNNPGPQPAGNPDGSCVTKSAGVPGAGTCALGYSQLKEGVDLLCVWTSAAPPAFAGTRDGGTCGNEGLVDPTANDGKPVAANDDVDVVRVVWQRAAAPPPPAATGYWLVARDGGIFAFGDAEFKGSTGAIKLNQPIVGMAAAPGNKGYWLVASDGGIFAFGEARFTGSTGATKLNQPIVSMDGTPTGNGYFLVARDGGVFAFGDAKFAGSTGALKLNQPIVGMAATPSGNGYWLVAVDGGIFAFGDARFYGSTGGTRLNKPVVGMAASPTGLGYWLVASDGGIFAYGDARFYGSTGGIPLNAPVVGMAAGLQGQGYWLVASDGGIFSYGMPFYGSTGGIALQQPIVGMAPSRSGGGYRFVARDGGIFC